MGTAASTLLSGGASLLGGSGSGGYGVRTMTLTTTGSVAPANAPATANTGSTMPSAPDISGGSNALMEAEREKERREAALRRHQGREVFTSGLGATGLAGMEKKTLLGG